MKNRKIIVTAVYLLYFIFASDFVYAEYEYLETINIGNYDIMDLDYDGYNLIALYNSWPKDKVGFFDLSGNIIKGFDALGPYSAGMTYTGSKVIFSGGAAYNGSLYEMNPLNGIIVGPVTGGLYIQPYLAYDGYNILVSGAATGSNGILTIPITKINANTYQNLGTFSVTVDTGTNMSGVSQSIIAWHDGNLFTSLFTNKIYQFDSNLNLLDEITIEQISSGAAIRAIAFVGDDLYVKNYSRNEIYRYIAITSEPVVVYTYHPNGAVATKELYNNTSVIKNIAYEKYTYRIKIGDANGDNRVDGGDLAVWQRNYDPCGLNAAGNTFAMGDWNGDGDIDGGDLALWQQNYDPLGIGNPQTEKIYYFDGVSIDPLVAESGSPDDKWHKESNYTGLLGDGKIHPQRNDVYDDMNLTNLIKYLTYEYYQSGRPHFIREYDPAGNLLVTHEYDDSGNLISSLEQVVKKTDSIKGDLTTLDKIENVLQPKQEQTQSYRSSASTKKGYLFYNELKGYSLYDELKGHSFFSNNMVLSKKATPYKRK